MAYLALFVALGGSSYAAIKVTGRNVPKDALTGADIKNLTGRDVKNNSLDSRDVKNLLKSDFRAGQLPAGAQGPQGARGPAGEPATRLWVAVHGIDTPEFAGQSGAATSVIREPGFATGRYLVNFNRSITNCGVAITLTNGGSEAQVQTRLFDGSLPANQVKVFIWNGAEPATTPEDNSFYLSLLC